MEQEHSPECVKIEFSGYSQITPALPTPHIIARIRGCRQRFLSTVSLFFMEILLPGIPRVLPLKAASSSRQDCLLSHPWSPAVPCGSDPAWAGLLGQVLPSPSPRGAGSGAAAHGQPRAGGGTAADRAEGAWRGHGPSPPCSSPGIGEPTARSVRRGRWGAERDEMLRAALVPLPTPPQVPAEPRAPRRRLYGLRAGPRCQSAPGSPLRGRDTTRRPLPAAATCGASAGPGPPQGGAGAVRGAGRAPRGGEGSPPSVWRGRAAQGPRRGGSAAGTRLRGELGPVPAAPPAGPALPGALVP